MEIQSSGAWLTGLYIMNQGVAGDNDHYDT